MLFFLNSFINLDKYYKSLMSLFLNVSYILKEFYNFITIFLLVIFIITSYYSLIR